MEKNQLEIEYNDIVQFEITEDFSIYYDKKYNVWYAMKNNETETIILQGDGLEFEEITIDGFTLTKNLFEKYKRIVENG